MTAAGGVVVVVVVVVVTVAVVEKGCQRDVTTGSRCQCTRPGLSTSDSSMERNNR